MSNKLKICVVRATAIATANEVVKHLKFGCFVSEHNEIDDYVLDSGELAGATYVTIYGRTNIGIWVCISIVVPKKKTANNKKAFPIEWVFVTIYKTSCSSRQIDNYIYLKCTFSDGDVSIERLEKPLNLK